MLTRLLHDRRANTLVIMAVSLIPISALAGSAVDMARLYVVKSRLQQACDAGVLAGRKFMSTTSTATTLDATATARAKTFFANNFTTGWLNTAVPTFTPTKTTDQQVAGTAAVKVPMTIMKMFAAPDVTVNVACKARYDIADTDIVFVLDTTGSMACRPEDSSAQCDSYARANPAVAYTRPSNDPTATGGYLGSTAYAVPESTAVGGSRIKALRQAVKDFNATVTASVDTNTQVRYGFVTYTSTVNAGKAIAQMSPSYLIGATSGETAKYQARRINADYVIDTQYTKLTNSKASCEASDYSGRRTPSTALTYNASNSEAIRESQFWYDPIGTINDACYYQKERLGPRYYYDEMDLPVSGFVTGNAVDDPTRVGSETARWEGCIEERQTETGVTSFTSASYDLDPERIPSSAAVTRWKPMWPEVTYGRWNYGNTVPDYTDGDSPSRLSLDDDSRRRSGFYSCGKPIKRLEKMTAAQVAAYVDAVDFKALGGTYHDVGMIWGTRLLSSKGIFASDNAGRAGAAAPRKVLVFLTDGDMKPEEVIYGLYGIEYFDRRVSGNGGSLTNLKAYHNARFLYECQRARDIGIDVWTVAIGLNSTPELTSCASSSDQALDTTSGSGLSAIFQRIAKQVAMLRIEL